MGNTESQSRPQKEGIYPGVGAVVESCHVHTFAEIVRHDSHGAKPGQQKEGSACFGIQEFGNPYIEAIKKRPQEVVLDFNAQKPEMGKGGLAGNAGEIVRILPDLPPVVEAQEYRKHLRPHGFDDLRRKEGIYAHRQKNHDDKGGIYPFDSFPAIGKEGKRALFPPLFSGVGQ